MFPILECFGDAPKPCSLDETIADAEVFQKGATKGSSNGQFAYASSKVAFLLLTRMMATTFVEAKIRVNSIAPGVFP